MLNKIKIFIVNVVKSAIVDVLSGNETLELPVEVKLLVDGKEKKVTSYVKTVQGNSTLVIAVEDKEQKEAV